MSSNIYLIPTNNGYKAKASDALPTYDAIALTKEMSYPVVIWNQRISYYLERSMHYDTARSRDELLCKLNLLGKEGAIILKIWDYNNLTVRNKDLDDLFNRCIAMKRDVYEKSRQ